ncbi:MAG: caspase family protein [Chitinophagaceae bacterium]|nr:caspase family protein [Chitinophagaceae bacterium]
MSITNGEKLQEDHSHSKWVSAIAVSKNKKYWASSSWDSTLSLHEADKLSGTYKFKSHEGRLRTITFSNNDKFILASNDRNSIYIWSVSDKKLVNELKINGGIPRVMKLSADGKMIFVGTHLGMISVWSIAEGKRIKEWQAHDGAINDMLFSSDQKYLVSAGADSKTVVWSWPASKLVYNLNDNQGEVNLITASADGKRFITASYDNAIRVWSYYDGKRKTVMSGHSFWVNNVSYDSTGSQIVTASNDNTARIWTAEGVLKQTLKGHTDWVNTAVFSKDGKYVLTSSNDRTAKLWQVSDGSELKTFNGHDDWVTSADFSPDGNYILTASPDNTAKIWLRTNGKLLFDLRGHNDWITNASYSSDGKWVLTSSIDNSVRIWDATTGKIQKVLEGKEDYIRYAVFSPDTKLIVTASKDNSIKLWQRESGKVLYNWKEHTDWISKVIFSPDGKLVASISLDNTIRIWSIGEGRLKYTLEGHTAGVSDAVFNIDGTRLLSASWDHTARVWNMQTGASLFVLNGHTDILNSVMLSPNGKFILTSSEDNTIRKWSAGNGELLYSFFSVDESDYLVIDPKGRYDGTAAARKLLYYVCGNEIIDFEQLKNLAWEPGLAEKLSGQRTEPITALNTEELPLCDFTPLVKELGFSNGKYHFSIQPRTGGLETVELFVNEKGVKSYTIASLVKIGQGYRLDIPASEVQSFFVAGEENVISVKASSKNETTYSRGAKISVIDTKKKPNPNMYIVSIGISRYKSDKLQLKFASKDSRELGSALSSAGSKLLNTDNKQHVFNYILNTDTSSKYWPSKKNIQAVMDSITRKAKPDDVVVVFFAGHGMLYNTGRSFYLLTSDASGFDIEGIEKQVGVSAEELNQWMSGIKANKQVLVLDACNSGKVIQRVKDVMGKREVPADQQRALERLKDKTGTFILSAAASDQSAYETSLYRQGLLTYSLLTGLKLGQGLKDNKFIDVNKWFNFAADNVKILAKDIGGRQDPQIIGNGSFDLGLVDQEVSNGIHLSIRRKLFRESRFIQDEQLLNDDLEIADIFDRELDNLSLSSKEVPIIFVAGNKLSDAYSVRGKYEVVGDTISLQAWVVKGSSERILSLQANGVVADKDKMITGLVEKIRVYFDTHE